jgi:hypothetical protein
MTVAVHVSLAEGVKVSVPADHAPVQTVYQHLPRTSVEADATGVALISESVSLFAPAGSVTSVVVVESSHAMFQISRSPVEHAGCDTAQLDWAAVL